jgi:hypothetical protein
MLPSRAMNRAVARVHLIVAAPLLLVGLITMTVHVHRAWTWETADGVMYADTKLRPIEFSTASGELVRVGNVLATRRKVSVGERFTVHYDPGDPQRAYVGLSPYGAVGLILLAVGGAFALSALYRLRRRRRAPPPQT